MKPMTPEQRERIAGRLVVAGISGGKDSAALSLWLTEQGVPHERVFLDTGWEHPATYEYLRGPLTAALGPITEVRADRLMVETILHKGMLPSRGRRWCTQDLKVRPMQRHLRTLQDAGHEAINAVGIRHAESEARAAMPEWEWSDTFDCEVWRPLVRWADADVVSIHARHGLKPNPLYLLGAERVGCWPCIYARKSEVRLLADIDPERVALLRELEATCTRAQQQRASAKGEAPKEPAAWFRWPIDEAVEWSRTSRGGKQFEMFAAAGRESGCMRWGMCDTGEGGES